MRMRVRVRVLCALLLGAAAAATVGAPTRAEAQQAVLARSLRLMVTSAPAGLTVTAVQRGVGRSAGFAVGDVVFAVDGERVTSARDLDDALLSGGEDPHDIDVLRGTQHLHVSVFRDTDGSIETTGRTPRLR